MTQQTKIKELHQYRDYGGGDVLIIVDNPTPECSNGYWIRPSNAAFTPNLSMLLSAFHTQSNVVIHGDYNQYWAGSSGKYCRYHKIRIIR